MSEFGAPPPIGPREGGHQGYDEESARSRERERRMRLRATGSNLAALVGLLVVIVIAGGVAWRVVSSFL